MKSPILALLLLTGLAAVSCDQTDLPKGADSLKEKERVGTDAKNAPSGESPPKVEAPSAVDITGKWKMDQLPSEVEKYKKANSPIPSFIIEFRRDGSFQAKYVWGDDKRTAEGTFQLEGSNLTLRTVKINSKPTPKETPDQIHKVAPDGKEIVTSAGQRLVRIP